MNFQPQYIVVLEDKDMAEATKYLNEDTADILSRYQIDTLNREINTFILQNAEANTPADWKVCPKCGGKVDYFRSGGYTSDKSGDRKKHMLKCPLCKSRFVEDFGSLTFYSHSDASVWNKVIEDTISGKSLANTAAEVNRHIVTLFHMRHKLLAFLEPENECSVLSKTTEADEKFVHECHKGLVNAEIDDSTRTITIIREPKKEIKPGLGDDKTCIITAVERSGEAYVHTANMGKPSSDDLRSLQPHIKDGTFVYTDGCTAYESVLKEIHSPFMALEGHESYDSENHLNFVNNLHFRMEEWLKDYRNVNTIYINRYNALFALRHKLTGWDPADGVIYVIRALRGKVRFFFERQQQVNIFDDPAAMKPREGLVPLCVINRLKKNEYSVIYAFKG